MTTRVASPWWFVVKSRRYMAHLPWWRFLVRLPRASWRFYRANIRDVTTARRARRRTTT